MIALILKLIQKFKLSWHSMQVKFVYESFKKLRLGIPVRCLHGSMKQTQRMLVLFNYTEEKHSLLFATDVASRGLDFPSIYLVVQVNCNLKVVIFSH